MAIGSAGDDTLRLVLDAAPGAMLVVDVAGRIVRANTEAGRAFGYTEQELLALGIDDLVPHRYRAGHAELRAEFAAAPARRAMGVGRELFGVRKDGTEMPVEVGLTPIRLADEHHVLASVVDLSERMRGAAERSAEREEHLVTHDGLTNLPNRLLLLRHLDTAFEAAGTAGRPVAMLLLDIDHFKRINDSLGHHLGDELLLVLAERLLAWARPGEFVARLGGDEFVIVFSGEVDHDIDARIRDLSSEVFVPLVLHGYELAVTASLGGATYPADGHDPLTLLKHADIAMYAAKAAGRTTVRWFEQRMLEDNNDRIALAAALRQGIERDELSLVYQPQLDLGTGRVVGVEALVRWHSPQLGNVPPIRFIPVAEESGMIIKLGRWVLRSACLAAAELSAEVGRPLRVAVNVSARQLHGEDWLTGVIDAIAVSGIRPSQLEIELTEGALVDDTTDVLAMLAALRSLGVTIAVDDFGMGYSNLAYLTKLPIDKIKIDRSFVAEVTDGDGKAAIVDAIIVMAHALGLSVLAEGVETEVQEEYLRRRGCDEVQGFRYSPGVTAGEVPALIRGVVAQ